jgi:hypothetical protein
MTMNNEYHTVRRRLKKVSGDVLSGMVGGGADDGGGGEPILANAPQQQPFECKLRNGCFLEKEERKNLIEMQKKKKREYLDRRPEKEWQKIGIPS